MKTGKISCVSKIISINSISPPSFTFTTCKVVIDPGDEAAKTQKAMAYLRTFLSSEQIIADEANYDL